jgi:hypothetical protein
MNSDKNRETTAKRDEESGLEITTGRRDLLGRVDQ